MKSEKEGEGGAIYKGEEWMRSNISKANVQKLDNSKVVMITQISLI